MRSHAERICAFAIAHQVEAGNHRFYNPVVHTASESAISPQTSDAPALNPEQQVAGLNAAGGFIQTLIVPGTILSSTDAVGWSGGISMVIYDIHNDVHAQILL